MPVSATGSLCSRLTLGAARAGPTDYAGPVMDQQGPAAAIARLRSTWDEQVSPSVQRALLALVFAVFFGSAHVARLGNPLPRIVAAGALVLTLAVLLARALVVRRLRADPRRIVRATV